MKMIRRLFLVFLVLVMLTGCRSATAVVVDRTRKESVISVIPLNDSIIYYYESLKDSTMNYKMLGIERLYFDGRTVSLGMVKGPNIWMRALIGNEVFIGTCTWEDGSYVYTVDLSTDQMTSEYLGEDYLLELVAFGGYLIRHRTDRDTLGSERLELEMYDPEAGEVVKVFDVHSIVPNSFFLHDMCVSGEYLYLWLTDRDTDEASLLKLNQDLEPAGTVDISTVTNLKSQYDYADVRTFEIYDDFIFVSVDGSPKSIIGTLKNDAIVDAQEIDPVYALLQCDSSSPVFTNYKRKELFFIDEKTNQLISKEIPLRDGFAASNIEKFGDKIIIFAHPTKKETMKESRKCYVTDRKFSGLPE